MSELKEVIECFREQNKKLDKMLDLLSARMGVSAGDVKNDTKVVEYEYVPVQEKYKPILDFVGTFIPNTSAKLFPSARGYLLTIYCVNRIDNKRFNEIRNTICNPEDAASAEINQEYAKFPINALLAEMIINRYREHLSMYSSSGLDMFVDAINIMRKYQVRFNCIEFDGKYLLDWGNINGDERLLLNRMMFNLNNNKQVINWYKLQIAEFIANYSYDLDYLTYEDHQRLKYTYDDSLEDIEEVYISRAENGVLEIKLESAHYVLVQVLRSMFPNAKVIYRDGKYDSLLGFDLNLMYKKYPVLVIQYLNEQIEELMIDKLEEVRPAPLF